MVLKTTFNNISAISWRSILLMEETGENHRQTLSQCYSLQLRINTFDKVSIIFLKPRNNGRSNDNDSRICQHFYWSNKHCICILQICQFIALMTRWTRYNIVIKFVGGFPQFPPSIKLNAKRNGKEEKYKQRSIKHTYKTKDRVTRTPLKTGGERRCSGRVNSSCSTTESAEDFPRVGGSLRVLRLPPPLKLVAMI
jgi:hypothetical protein